MNDFSMFPPPHAPFVAPRRSHTVDVVVTSLLLAIHFGGFVLVAFFSLFWVMGTDACGYHSCNYDYLTWAYALTDLVGVVVLMITAVFAIVLMARKHIAFWVPLVGMAIQIALVAASFGLLDNVVG